MTTIISRRKINNKPIVLCTTDELLSFMDSEAIRFSLQVMDVNHLDERTLAIYDLAETKNQANVVRAFVNTTSDVIFELYLREEKTVVARLRSLLGRNIKEEMTLLENKSLFLEDENESV